MFYVEMQAMSLRATWFQSFVYKACRVSTTTPPPVGNYEYTLSFPNTSDRTQHPHSTPGSTAQINIVRLTMYHMFR